MAATLIPTPRPRRRVPAGLRRQLGLLGTISVSVGVMAPTLAMSITGVEPARLIGRAGPLAFVFAGLGVGLVAYGFVRLSGEYSQAGSVYAFVGNVLGPRAGFVAGWALLGTYLVFPAVSISAIAVFLRAFLHDAGIAANAAWLPLALLGWIVVGALASREVRIAARSLLSIELVSVALILGLMAVIVIKLASGDAPRGQDVNLEFLDLPDGVSLSTIALASTFGFLSFAGFESAGSMGEESHAPKHAIPRSIVAAIAAGAVFYVACMAVQTLGFGTDAAGVEAFTSSEAPLSALAGAYVGGAMPEVLSLVAAVSAVGAGLGCACVGARTIFALARDRGIGLPLSGVSGNGAPAVGLAIVLGFDLVGLVAFAAAGTEPMRVFFYFATLGVLSLLCMYVLTNVAAVRFLLARGGRGEALLPVLGIAVAAYVLYRNVWPVPDPPFNAFPYVVAAWLVLGVAVALLRPPPPHAVADRA